MPQTVIVQSAPQAVNDDKGAYFKSDAFKSLVWKKGRRVLRETAIQCPCKGDTINQLSDCENCGGTGWLFLNPTETRMVIQKFQVINKYKDYSEKAEGTINVSCIDSEELCEMDRITVLDAQSIFNEVLKFRTVNGTTFAYTSYNVTKPIYAAYFVNSTTALTRIFYGTDYTINNNQFILLNDTLISMVSTLSVSVRYFHAPQYHVIEMNRETMQSWDHEKGDGLINLPVNGIARRAHYILGAKNLTGSNIIDNSFNVCSANYVIRISDYGGSQMVVVTPPPVGVIPSISYDFTNQTNFTVFHGYGRLPNYKLWDADGNELEGEVTATVSTVNVKFNASKSGTLVLD